MRRVLIPFDVSPQAPPVGGAVSQLDGLTMGTTWSVKVIGPRQRNLETLKAGIQQQLDDVVAQMSTWEHDSVITRYNNSNSGTWHDVPAEFLFVLRYALNIARISGGAYDPTAGSLVDVWGFGPASATGTRPDAAQLNDAKNRTGWQRVEISNDAQRVLQPGGVRLDFSAIAKGFGVDQVSRYLSQQGFDSHLVEVGGELRGAGVKSDAMPWWVTLEHPLATNGAQHPALQETVIGLHGLSVATSGDYRRYFDIDGRRYSHTIDPRSGEPIQHGLASVTVIHPECIAADALSTALGVMGVEQGMTFAGEHKIPARFVIRTPDGFAEYVSPAFEQLS